MTTTTRTTLRIGHSPDPDDAFMWYPLANFPDGSGPGGKTYTPCIDTGPYDFVHVLEDIQSLNERSERGELEITALSIHEYPYVADKYAMTSCGSSMGDGYGPMVVAKENFNLRELFTPVATPEPQPPKGSKRRRLAIPGKRTSAWLALQLRLLELGCQPGAERTIDYDVVMFDQIIPKVVAGEYDAGLIIHEGQLTYSQAGLACIEDLGKWWTSSRRLPLPLGGNAIRRDLGPEKMEEICNILLESIRYALDHRDEAVEYALHYARDMGKKTADKFVGMYVNDWTLDYGDKGRQAVQQFLDEATDAGLVPKVGKIDFVSP
ncbi:MAG: ABC transporter substrate-binding protein [Phycisphaera sp.]|nr:ABC transporter substrate-binding protein [Phycisphaera sp.]